jgi:hypothetical protein
MESFRWLQKVSSRPSFVLRSLVASLITMESTTVKESARAVPLHFGISPTNPFFAGRLTAQAGEARRVSRRL